MKLVINISPDDYNEKAYLENEQRLVDLIKCNDCINVNKRIGCCDIYSRTVFRCTFTICLNWRPRYELVY